MATPMATYNMDLAVSIAEARLYHATEQLFYRLLSTYNHTWAIFFRSMGFKVEHCRITGTTTEYLRVHGDSLTFRVSVLFDEYDDIPAKVAKIHDPLHTCPILYVSRDQPRITPTAFAAGWLWHRIAVRGGGWAMSLDELRIGATRQAKAPLYWNGLDVYDFDAGSSKFKASPPRVYTSCDALGVAVHRGP